MLDDLLDEPEPKRSVGIDVVTAQVIGERALVTEATGERPAGADLGDQAEAAECGYDHCTLAGDDEVAGQRPRQAYTGRGAVERGDEDRVRPGDEPGDPTELTANPPPHVGRPLRFVERFGRD